MSLLTADASAAIRASAPEPDFAALQQAAEWFAVLRSPAVTEADIEQWQRWRDTDSAHGQAWARVETISGKFENLPTGNRPRARMTLDVAAQKQVSRRRALKMLGLLCSTGLATWAGARVTPWREWTAAHRTATGERRELQMADGTGIWLNTASAMDVDYGPELRRVKLVAGEILIQTAKDTTTPARPFVVDTAQGRLRALGTRFSVRQLEGVSHVAVFEGAVEIRPIGNPSATQILRAGEQAQFTALTAETPEPADPARQSWTRGLLLAENMRLGDFITELARYRHGYLDCAPEVADLRIVGAYNVDDTDRVLAALQATLPVQVRATLPWWVVVEPR